MKYTATFRLEYTINIDAEDVPEACKKALDQFNELINSPDFKSLEDRELKEDDKVQDHPLSFASKRGNWRFVEVHPEPKFFGENFTQLTSDGSRETDGVPF